MKTIDASLRSDRRAWNPNLEVSRSLAYEYRVHSGRPPEASQLQGASLGRLEDHGLKNVCHIRTLVRGGFQNFVDFLPLDNLDGIAGIFE